MTTVEQPRGASLGDARNALVVLAVAVFGAVTTELVPVGLLPQISAALDVGTGTAGLLVSAYAVMVAALSVPLSHTTRRLPRKPLLLSTVAGYVASNVVAAVAPTFAVLAAGRVLGGVTHALFFSVCIGYAARLVPPAMTGRAMALASVGVSGGFVLGVPLTTALGATFGWRAAYWCLAAVVSLVLALAAVVLPAVDTEGDGRGARTGRRRDLTGVVVANGLTYLGTYVLYTYVSVLLLGAGVGERWIGLVLLAFGVCGLLGLRLAAAQLDLRPRTSAILVPAVMTAGLAGVAVSYPQLALVVVGAGVWLTAFGPAASLYQAASVRIAASSPETAGAWINASSNAGIAGGAAIGAVVVGHGGVGQAAWVSAGLLASSAVLAAAARSSFPARGDVRTASRRDARRPVP
ncbi:MFS transporter [Terrabacter sp. NPDC000476]|uniref:MFS transporter n=1 Tax=Terrabacter sp. NPDC000476 TaxID=3154258 RepID=UPI00331A212F